MTIKVSNNLQMESLDEQISRQRNLIATMNAHFEKQVQNLNMQIERRKLANEMAKEMSAKENAPIEHKPKEPRLPLRQLQPILRPRGRK